MTREISVAHRPTMRVSPSRRKAVAAGLAACLLLSGCDTIGGWFDSEDEGPRLGGNRISVLQLEQSLEPDPTLQQAEIALPEAQANAAWTQPGGDIRHAPGHLALGRDLREVWRVAIEGGTRSRPLLSGPVVANGRVYVLDTEFDLHAIDAATGATVWTANVVRPDQEGEAFGGGVSVGDDGRLFVTTGYGEAVAIDPANGSEIWRQRIAGPIRSAPTVAQGRVFVVATDNQTITLAAENRVLQWTHTGILETAALLGGSSAAVENDIVIVPYSSGELYALRVENGVQAWSDNLATVRRGSAAGALADIRGLPVIDRGLVFAVSHSGRMAAINLRTGQRAWEQDIGGINTPYVAGDWIFVLSNEAQLVALARDTGRIRWISQLQQFEDEEDREDPLVWAGPILAGGRLILVNSEAELVEVSPRTGEVVNKIDLPDATLLPPVVADNTLYVLTDDGDLVAYR
ncbi:outer membrane protein assembly factor BamB family protein [Indioceanicola profundi]|uniref:outer membrane protein assembly factor BamB family protein n=1 Tax=Indioceanicola profundi TaxID=2220096 RepID=UPI001CECBC0F|nr:PQQ-binding-like beta-propeller repeat protein [Indioceanicola profundi]